MLENIKCDSEEERRLFYVGMTRARNLLYLTNAQNRFLYGKTYNLSQSPYIKAIEQELLEEKKIEYKKKKKPLSPQSQQELF